MIAIYVGGPRCGRTLEVSPDNAPAEVADSYSGGVYRLAERVTKRGPGAPPDNFEGLPVYEYEPPRAAAERSVFSTCKCGCRRTGADA